MNRDALKFTDFKTFVKVVEEMGYNGEVTDLLYEQGELPYGTAYFIPTNLLPEAFDFDVIDEFGGVITQVEQVRYLGTEEYDTAYMVFPFSMVAYVEIDSPSPINLEPDATDFDWTTGEMVFVINLEDGGGKEFFLTTNGTLSGLADESSEEPRVFKTHKQVDKQLDLLREKYPKTCRAYAVDQREFEARRKRLQVDPDL